MATGRAVCAPKIHLVLYWCDLLEVQSVDILACTHASANTLTVELKENFTCEIKIK